MPDLRAVLRRRVAERWPVADAFYRERDDRTARLVGNIAEYGDQPVEIHVDPMTAHDVTVQRIALIAANLTTRWARSVRVVVPSGTLLHGSLRSGGLATLADRVDWEMAHADPFGISGVRDRPLRLFVGPWHMAQQSLKADDFCVHATHWTALGRRGHDIRACDNRAVSSPATVAATALAASLGAADLFKRAIGQNHDDLIRTFAWDTWAHDFVLGPQGWDSVTRRPVPGDLDFGRTLLAGVGAIGSALVYLMRMMSLRGAITLFDRDHVDVTNLNRSPLFTVLDALAQRSKTSVGKQYLEGLDLTIEAQNGNWRDHVEKFAVEQFDVWISLTNEDGAWAEVPFHLPPVVLHGTTTSGWGFGAGRHIPRVEDCTLCRMPRPEQEFRGPCAVGGIAHPANQEPVRASLPFLSTASAALLLSLYTRLITGLDGGHGVNDIAADLTSGLPAIIGVRRLPTATCRGCRIMHSSVWRERGGRGRFAKLSN